MPPTHDEAAVAAANFTSIAVPGTRLHLHSASAPPPHPLVRQPSGAEQIEMFVEEAFDEMDEALARQQRHTEPQFEARPSVEEQAWLDAEYDNDMILADMDEAPLMDEADVEEEEYVRQMLALHPALDEEEARWLYERERYAREHANDSG